MAKPMKLEGYTFEKISDEEYKVTMPNGETHIKYYLAAENLIKQLKKQQEERNPNYLEQVHAKVQNEVKKLKAVAETLNAFQDKYTFTVQNCYQDANRGTVYTTIVALRHKDNAEYMYLTSDEVKEIANASFTEYSRIISGLLTKIKKGDN